MSALDTAPLKTPEQQRMLALREQFAQRKDRARAPGAVDPPALKLAWAKEVCSHLVAYVRETELRARQLSAVAKKDPFVAGLLSGMWLQSLASVTEEQLPSLEDREAWRVSIERLKALHDEMTSNQVWKSQALRYIGALEIDASMRHALGDENAAILSYQTRASQLVDAKAIPLWFILSLVGIPIALVGIFDGQDWGPVLLIINLLFSVWVALQRYENYQLARVALRQAEELMAEHDVRRAFLADPERGQIIATLQKEHPALIAPLPRSDTLEPVYWPALPPAPPLPPPTLAPPEAPQNDDASAKVVERPVIIERQVIVGRCKYCKSLTPVDAPVCQNCGANGFI